MIRIYVKNGCPHCEGILIPEGIKAEKVFVDQADFVGYIPPQVPCLQENGITLAGPPMINGYLLSIKKAQDGEYRL